MKFLLPTFACLYSLLGVINCQDRNGFVRFQGYGRGRGREHNNQPIIWPANNLPTCHGSRIHKLMLNQSNYVQYAELFTNIPRLTSFTTCYWFNLITTGRTATMLNYADFDRGIHNMLTISFEQTFSKWNLLINNKLAAKVDSPKIESNKWYHACQSWDSQNGAYKFYLNGELIAEGINQQLINEVIPSGGILVTGQNQNTLGNGMDRFEGLEGWLTLLSFDSNPLQSNAHGQGLVRYLYQNCKATDTGNIVSWIRTPRKGYGGVMEAPAREICGQF